MERIHFKNRVDEAIEAVLAYAVEQPAHGQVRVSNELRKRGTFVSPSGVRSIWLRNGGYWSKPNRVCRHAGVRAPSETASLLGQRR